MNPTIEAATQGFRLPWLLKASSASWRGRVAGVGGAVRGESHSPSFLTHSLLIQQAAQSGWGWALQEWVPWLFSTSGTLSGFTEQDLGASSSIPLTQPFLSRRMNQRWSFLSQPFTFYHWPKPF